MLSDDPFQGWLLIPTPVSIEIEEKRVENPGQSSPHSSELGTAPQTGVQTLVWGSLGGLLGLEPTVMSVVAESSGVDNSENGLHPKVGRSYDGLHTPFCLLEPASGAASALLDPDP